MSVSGVNVGNVGLLFTKYEKAIVNTLSNEAKAFKECKTDMNWSGDFIEFRLHVARNTAMGFAEDGSAFPIASKQTYVAAKIGRRFYHAKLRITDGAMAAAKESPDVARDVIQSEVRGITDDAMKFYNGFFFLDGTGTVATFKDAAPGSTTNNVQFDDARLLWQNGSYQVYNSTLVTNRGTMVVADVDKAITASGYSSVDFTAATPSGTVTGDVLVWNNSVNRAMNGLAALINDGATTFQNVNCATYPRYTSMVMDNSGTLRAPTPRLIRQALAGLKQKTGSDNPSGGLTCYSNNWVGISFEEMNEGELRLDPADTTQGYASSSFQSVLGKVNLVMDSDCKRNTIFMADKSQLVHAVQRPLSFRKQGGDIFLRSDEAGYHTATMMCISQMYIKERHTSARINDVYENATVSM